jgi:small subunit ribosomal protein S1
MSNEQAAVTGTESPTGALPGEPGPNDGAEVTQPEAVAAVPEASASETEKPRLQLNPTVDPESMKAVPNVVVEVSPEVAEAAVVAAKPAIPAAEKVEIPHEKSLTLDASLEAEINSAMAGSQAALVAPEGQPPAAPSGEELKPGQKLKGRIQSVQTENIIVDLGPRASGLLQVKQYEGTKVPEVGATVDVVVDKFDPAEGLVHLRPAKGGVTKPQGDWSSVAEGQIVDCVVTKTNKGGLEVNISNLRGFMPASQIDFGFVQNMEQYVGQKLRVKISEVNPAKKSLVVSRRSFLDMERQELKSQAWGNLAVGQTHSGVVKTIKDYGAFVDIGGVDGLLHVGELSWSRVNHPKEILQEGQRIEVKILSIDQEKQKVSLGMRQLSADPWAVIADKYLPGTVIKAKVTKTTDFGAFVELEPNVEGLVHISELEHRRVVRVTDVVQSGQEVDLKVLAVDTEKRRISLSKKALIDRPQSEKKPSDEDQAPSKGTAYERKHKGPLRGGGTGSGGLLFGDPNAR